MKNFWNLTSSKFVWLTLFCLFLLRNSYAQSSGDAERPFDFPIQKGKANYLSGTMGEIRATHIHSGIDIKTNGKVGFPIYAIADGNVSRLKISTGGYGNALYLLHPNGKTSVYAHLLAYEGELEKWIRKKQYEQESFEIELFPEKNQFYYKKGDLIGYAGNSGSSSGPHLHFEIRDKYQAVLNPLDYEFEEIKDTQPPVVRSIALETLSPFSRIKDQFGRFEYKLKSNGNNYSLSKPLEVFGKIGLEIQAFDRHDGSWSHNGIQHIEVFKDDERIFSQKIDRFTFAETRNVLVINNYAVYQKKRQKFFRLYRADGNKISFYDHITDRGILTINDTSQTHQIRVQLTDSYGNQTKVNIELKGSYPKHHIDKNKPYISDNGHILYEKDLLIFTKRSADVKDKLEVFANRRPYELLPAYVSNQQAVFLWDMKQGLPDSAVAKHTTLTFDFKATAPSETEFNYFGKNMNVYFPKEALYDTLFIQTDYRQDEGREIFTLNDLTIPLRKYISVSLKTNQNYDRKFAGAYYIDRKGRYSYEGGEWNGEKLTFRTRDLGDYTILEDREAPSIRAVKVKPDAIDFRIDDELSGIKSYNATVDGKWILLHYDYKQKKLWGNAEDWPFELNGELLLTVEDEQGNLNTFKSQL